MKMAAFVLTLSMLPCLGADSTPFPTREKVEALAFFKTYNLKGEEKPERAFPKTLHQKATFGKSVVYAMPQNKDIYFNLYMKRLPEEAKFHMVNVFLLVPFMDHENPIPELDERIKIYTTFLSSFKDLAEDPGKIVSALANAEDEGKPAGKVYEKAGKRRVVTHFYGLLTSIDVSLD